MSDFSDKEDRMLVQLVYQHIGKRISWTNIAKKMKSKKRPEQLRLRVTCLKKRLGNGLSNFPRWYFLKPVSSKFQQPKPQRQRENVTGAAGVQNVVQKVRQMKCLSVKI